MRRRASQTQVSLFPFLAVLVSTMGALIFLLLVITRQAQLQRAQAKAEAEIEAPAERPPLELPPLPELKTYPEPAPLPPLQLEPLAEVEPASVPDLTDVRPELKAQIGALRQRLGEHRRQAEGPLVEQAELAEAKSATEAIKRRLEMLADGREQRAAALREAEVDLERLKNELLRRRREADSVSNKFAIVPYVGANGTTRRPIYLECLTDRIVMQPEGVTITADQFGNIRNPNNPLARMVDAVIEHMDKQDGGSKPYPLMIVRPGGIAAYYAARSALESLDLPFGYELVEADMEIDFPDRQEDIGATALAAVQSAVGVVRQTGPNQWRIGGIGPGGMETSGPGAPSDAAGRDDAQLDALAESSAQRYAALFAMGPAQREALGETTGRAMENLTGGDGENARSAGSSSSGTEGAGGSPRSASPLQSQDADSALSGGPFAPQNAGQVETPGPMPGPKPQGAEDGDALSPGDRAIGNTLADRDGSKSEGESAGEGKGEDSAAELASQEPSRTERTRTAPGENAGGLPELPPLIASQGDQAPTERPDGNHRQKAAGESTVSKNAAASSAASTSPVSSDSRPDANAATADASELTPLEKELLPESALGQAGGGVQSRMTFDELIFPPSYRSARQSQATSESEDLFRVEREPTSGQLGQTPAVGGVRVIRRPLRRVIDIECRSEGLRMFPDQDVLMLTSDADTLHVARELLAKSAAQVKLWGSAGPTSRWTPVLRLHVRPDGLENYYRIKLALLPSGVEIERRMTDWTELVHAAQLAGETW